MFITSIVRENTMDDYAGHGHTNSHDTYPQGMMSTDIMETDQGYEMEISLPGINKNDIRMQLKDGYLTIGARTGNETEDNKKEGRYICRERFAGKMMRTFFVGKDVKESDIHPKYENGILSFKIPKADQIVEDKHHYISIE